MLGSYKFKYHGILKSFDLNSINKDTFQLLINAQIFDINELSNNDLRGDYQGIELDNYNQSPHNCYCYNHQWYDLKLNVFEDMFDYCEFTCEPNDELERKTRNLEFHLETCVSNHSKIQYLKQVVFDVKNQIMNKDYYLLYTRNLKIDGYKSWFKFFMLEQIDGEDFTYIFKYLKGSYDFVPPFIKNLWENCYFAKGLMDFCTKKILHYERISGINEAEVTIDKYSKSNINYLLSEDDGEEKEYHDIRLDIFEDLNSRKAFDFILSEWKGKKDTAFYSRVFKFLQSKKYIILEGDDNDIYREFIMSNFSLDSYARIQKRTSIKENDVWAKAFKSFEESLKKFEKVYSEL